MLRPKTREELEEELHVLLKALRICRSEMLTLLPRLTQQQRDNLEVALNESASAIKIAEQEKHS